MKSTNYRFGTTSFWWCKLLCLLIFSLHYTSSFAQLLAFPTAEGYGKYAVGGRGGKVYEVTTLADDGPGSFRQAFYAYPGQPLTIVFKVGGIIDLLTPIKVQRSNMTIAGQTAPGDGICTKRSMVKIYGNNVIIRYMHFRPGDVAKTNNPAVYGLDMENSSNIIVDHCSMSWAMEENATFYDNKYSTVQWCIVSESLNSSYNGKGSHGYAGVWGGQFASYHHNLLAHHHSRAIRFNGSRTHDTLAYIDYRNNVIYNWGNDQGCYGIEIEIADTGKAIFGLRRSEVNIMNNYYKPGPATPVSRGKIILNQTDAYVAAWANRPVGKVYMDGNFVFGVPTVTANNWLGLKPKYYPASYIDSFKLSAPTQNEPIVMETALNAYNAVLASAGANYPKRDTVDRRIVKETRTGTASQHSTNVSSTYYGLGNIGIIDTQDSIGGWPNYDSTTLAPTDSDHDGMPDTWETANGYNPNDSLDGNTVTASGYTALETYLNNLLGTTLPLHLLSFKVAALPDQAFQLNWATANEVNTARFHVEYSQDARRFETVGIVEAKNQVINCCGYQWVGRLANPSGKHYFRLRMEDKSGIYTYSNLLTLQQNEGISLTVQPNPATNHLVIAHTKASLGASISIYSLSGKLCYNTEATDSQTAINIQSLQPGVYTAVFQNNGGKQSASFIKQ